MSRRFLKILTVTLFCVIISFPLVNTLFNFVSDTESLENRRLHARPGFDITLLDPYPMQLDSFYNDHFNLRNRMVQYFSNFKLQVFNKSSFPERVFVGWDGWLFHTYSDLDAYQGKNNFTKNELEDVKLELEYRKEVLDSMGCKFYFAVAPGKPNIYSEKMPYYMFRYSQKGWGEQLLAYLDQDKTISTVNLYNTLRNKKSEHQLYYKLDTHWNNWGAYYALNAIVDQIKTDQPDLSISPLDSFMVAKTSAHHRNCAQILGYPESIYDVDELFIPLKAPAAKQIADNIWQNPKKPKPRIVVMGDSFCYWIIPLISQQFGTTIYSFDYRKYEFNKKQLQEWKPDILLMLIHEPQLRKILESSCRPKNNKVTSSN